MADVDVDEPVHRWQSRAVERSTAAGEATGDNSCCPAPMLAMPPAVHSKTVWRIHRPQHSGAAVIRAKTGS